MWRSTIYTMCSSASVYSACRSFVQVNRLSKWTQGTALGTVLHRTFHPSIVGQPSNEVAASNQIVPTRTHSWSSRLPLSVYKSSKGFYIIWTVPNASLVPHCLPFVYFSFSDLRLTPISIVLCSESSDRKLEDIDRLFRKNRSILCLARQRRC